MQPYVGMTVVISEGFKNGAATPPIPAMVTSLSKNEYLPGCGVTLIVFHPQHGAIVPREYGLHPDCAPPRSFQFVPEMHHGDAVPQTAYLPCVEAEPAALHELMQPKAVAFPTIDAATYDHIDIPAEREPCYHEIEGGPKLTETFDGGLRQPAHAGVACNKCGSKLSSHERNDNFCWNCNPPF